LEEHKKRNRKEQKS